MYQLFCGSDRSLLLFPSYNCAHIYVCMYEGLQKVLSLIQILDLLHRAYIFMGHICITFSSFISGNMLLQQKCSFWMRFKTF